MRALIIEKRVQNLNRLTTCSSDSLQAVLPCGVVLVLGNSADVYCAVAQAQSLSQVKSSQVYYSFRNHGTKLGAFAFRLSDSDWGGPTLKNRSGAPMIGAILSALAPRHTQRGKRMLHPPAI